MKKILLGILLGILVLGVSGVATASLMIPVSEKAKDRGVAVDNSPVISGDWALSTRGLEKIEFIHYKKGYGKIGTVRAPKPLACYKFLTPTKIKWTTLPASYVINPTNLQGLDESFITSIVFSSAETWDVVTSKELMNDSYTIDYAASYGVQNYKNAVVFGNYPTTGVIAVTTVWYNPATKTIVEFDIMFDTDYIWGDAAADETKMDLQNIATHEFGHGVGLGDVYESACSAVTMYGYSNYGDIEKRTLEQPDIIGLQTLYGF